MISALFSPIVYWTNANVLQRVISIRLFDPGQHFDSFDAHILHFKLSMARYSQDDDYNQADCIHTIKYQMRINMKEISRSDCLLSTEIVNKSNYEI